MAQWGSGGLGNRFPWWIIGLILFIVIIVAVYVIAGDYINNAFQI